MISCPVHKIHYKHLGLIDRQSRRLSKDRNSLLAHVNGHTKFTQNKKQLLPEIQTYRNANLENATPDVPQPLTLR